jgi:hypothetical protein
MKRSFKFQVSSFKFQVSSFKFQVSSEEEDMPLLLSLPQ